MNRQDQQFNRMIRAIEKLTDELSIHNSTKPIIKSKSKKMKTSNLAFAFFMVFILQGIQYGFCEIVECQDTSEWTLFGTLTALSYQAMIISIFFSCILDKKSDDDV